MGSAGLSDDAVLVVSELVENAVRHARSAPVLRVELRPSGLSLAVQDDDPTPPTLYDAPVGAGHRGVQLVDRICRNALMYFNQETQAKILGRFHFALVPKGVLFLGKAEMLLSHSRIFDPIDLKRRIFRKAAGITGHQANFVSHAMVHDRRMDLGGIDELREHAFGRPLRDLDVSYRPVDLRGYVEQARVERKSFRIKDVEWMRGPGESFWFEIHVNPLVRGDNTILGVSVVLHDVTAARRLLEDLEYANRQLESAYEELQSTNEELQTINDALRERSTELDQVNEFLESVLTSLRARVIVLDLQMRVLAWNRGAEELWGLRRDEAEGEHLLNLDIGLPVSELRHVVRSALADAAFIDEVKVSAVNRRGRDVRIRVVCSSLRGNGGEPGGAILVMEQQDD